MKQDGDISGLKMIGLGLLILFLIVLTLLTKACAMPATITSPHDCDTTIIKDSVFVEKVCDTVIADTTYIAQEKASPKNTIDFKSAVKCVDYLRNGRIHIHPYWDCYGIPVFRSCDKFFSGEKFYVNK